MTDSLLFGFAIGWLGSMPIAGPIAFFICRRGLAGRFRDGIALACGAALTEACWCLALLLGVDELLDIWPSMTSVARSLGGLLLIALGLFFFTRRHAAARRAACLKEQATAPTLRVRFRDEFRLGVTLILVNPSIPFNWLAVITIAISLGLDPGRMPAAFALGVGLGAIAWFALFLRMIIAWSDRLNIQMIVRVQQGFAALLICAGSYALWQVWT
jgi:threonine/homoserine/homoserine lactone efflux protein